MYLSFFVSKFLVYYHKLWEKFVNLLLPMPYFKFYFLQGLVLHFQFNNHFMWGNEYSTDFELHMLGLNETYRFKYSIVYEVDSLSFKCLCSRTTDQEL